MNHPNSDAAARPQPCEPRIWWRILAEEALEALPLAGCFEDETAPPAIFDIIAAPSPASGDVPREEAPARAARPADGAATTAARQTAAEETAIWGAHADLVEAWFADGDAERYAVEID